MKREEREVQVRSTAAVVVGVALFAASYYILPTFFTFPTDMAERLAFAAQASTFVLLWVVGAIGVVSYRRRKSSADIRGSAYAPPSPYIAVWVAFLQNTLEQALITIGLFFAIATLLSGPALAFLPAAVVLFSIGRTAFLVRYASGAGKRAFGMALTMTPAILGYPLVIFLIVRNIFS